MRRCVCGTNGYKCSKTNPTCDYDTGTCQCGVKKTRYGAPYTICYVGQICILSRVRDIGPRVIGKCIDAISP